MDAIRLQRLRCLSDTGDIKIKPITVLLGQNSAGKSTFLRVFPLLKQSVESRTIGPFLWNGRLVDFGNYEDAHQKKSNEITQLVDQSLSLDWEDIGQILINWFICDSPIRA